MRGTVLWILLSISLPAVTALNAQQVVLDQTEDLDFDRPESWAMKYYGSVTLLTSLGGPDGIEPDLLAAAGSDTERNPFGCLEPSSDRLAIRYGALELANRFELGRLSPYVTLFASHFDTELRVDARYRDIVDRSHLRTDGWTWGATAGLSWRATDRMGAGVEVFYSPLAVFRSPNAPTETDELLHARAMVTYRIRSPRGSRSRAGHRDEPETNPDTDSGALR